MIAMKTSPVKDKRKKYTLLKAHKQFCIAHTGIAESVVVHLYATTLKKLYEHVLPIALDDDDQPVQFTKNTPIKISLIDVGDCDYREVLHVEDFPKSNIAETDLSFLKGKYGSDSFKITVILQRRKLYFLGQKIDIKNIKTNWF